MTKGELNLAGISGAGGSGYPEWGAHAINTDTTRPGGRSSGSRAHAILKGEAEKARHAATLTHRLALYTTLNLSSEPLASHNLQGTTTATLLWVAWYLPMASRYLQWAHARETSHAAPPCLGSQTLSVQDRETPHHSLPPRIQDLTTPPRIQNLTDSGREWEDHAKGASELEMLNAVLFLVPRTTLQVQARDTWLYTLPRTQAHAEGARKLETLDIAPHPRHDDLTVSECQMYIGYHPAVDNRANAVNCMPEGSGFSKGIAHQRKCACAPLLNQSIYTATLRDKIHEEKEYNSEQRQ